MKTGDALAREIATTTTGTGECAFWWLGQHGFVIKLGSAICYLDPFLTPLEGREVPPLMAPADLRDATLVAGSHDHADHIDRPAWPAIAAAAPEAVFILPEILRPGIVAALGLPEARVRGIDHGRSVTVGGVTVHGVPAAHEFLDRDPDTGLHPYLGFVLEGNGMTVYHAGDTCLYEGLQAILRRWRFDLAFLPINGRDARRLAGGCLGNMTYQEAADLAGALRPGLTVPTHFEMFAMNSADPTLFADYMAVKYPTLPVQVPVHGTRVTVAARASA